MNFQEVLVDGSKQLIDIVADEIGNDEKVFRELLDFSFSDKNQFSNRASRVVYSCCFNYSELFFKNANTIISKLYTLKDKSVIRNLLHIIVDYIDNINNEEQQGKIADLCFTWIVEPKEPIALRHYSMKVLFQLTKKYPEISPELITILENILIDESTGLKNQSKNMLKVLYKP